MSKPVRIERAAEEELRGSIIWYEGRRAGLGAEFYREVQRILKLIERNPQLGGPVPNVPHTEIPAAHCCDDFHSR